MRRPGRDKRRQGRASTLPSSDSAIVPAVRVSLMIEGQEGVTWEDWQALAGACEEHGVEALFRSDHYLSVEGHADRGSLDAWATLAALVVVMSMVRLRMVGSSATISYHSELAQ